MFNFMKSPYYAALVVFVVMPLNGILMVEVDFLMGFLLVLTQVPWFISTVISKLDNWK